MLQIKKIDGTIIYQGDFQTAKNIVEQAIEDGTDLSGANLSGANLQ